jgi:hypothetical protein
MMATMLATSMMMSKCCCCHQPIDMDADARAGDYLSSMYGRRYTPSSGRGRYFLHFCLLLLTTHQSTCTSCSYVDDTTIHPSTIHQFNACHRHRNMLSPNADNTPINLHILQLRQRYNNTSINNTSVQCMSLSP